jgi:hypothetical protein
MSKLKMGKMVAIPYNEIKPSDMNRDLIKHHTDTLSESYKDYGVMRPFIVTKKDKNGFHILLDVTHGYDSIENLVSPNDLMPCYVVDWVDPNNETDVKKAIIRLNINRKGWKIPNYIKSHARDLGGIYSLMNQSLINYTKKGLSSGVIVSCYDKERDTHSLIKSADFTYDTTHKPFTDKLLSFFAELTTTLNAGVKKQLPNNFNRELVCRIWESIEGWNHDYKRFLTLLKQIDSQINISIANSNLPGNKDMIDDWYKSIVKVC